MNKRYYTKTSVDKQEVTTTNQNGDVISGVKTKTITYKLRKIRTDGMSLMRKKTVFDLLPEVANSNLDIRIISKIVKSITQEGFVGSGTVHTTVTGLAKEFETTPRKVRDVVKRLEEVDLVRRVSKRIYVNPYIILPYGVSQDQGQLLQLRWNDGYTRSDSELLEAVQMEESITKNEVVL